MSADHVIQVLRDGNARTYIHFATGRTLMHTVVLDGAVRLEKLPLEYRRYLVPLLLDNKPYPVARAVRRMRHAGKMLGITDGAAKALTNLSQHP